MNDEAVFAKENFDKFNFPFKNQGSFTDRVEVWQDCLENAYGEPTIVTNPNGTECDRMWKMMYGQNGQTSKITIHFYNHNKPKDRKQSKLLIQGAVQFLICEYDFCSLPQIYKMVSLRKILNVPSLRHETTRQ